MARFFHPIALSPHLTIALLLAGCVASVKVTHFVPPDRLGPEAYGRTARVYVLVKGRPSVDVDSSAAAKLWDTLVKLGADKEKALARPLTPEERESLAHGAAAAFATAGSHAAYQVVYDDKPPPALAEFGPTASLWIEPSDPSARQEVFEAEVSSTQKKTRYRIHLSFGFGWKLLAEPERTVLAQGKVPASGDFAVKSERDRKVPDIDNVIRDAVRDRRAAFLALMQTDLLPHDVQRHRSMDKGKGLNLEAYKRFEKTDWEGAAALWRRAAEQDQNDWLARHHLGVHHERKGEWDEARRQYQAALAVVKRRIGREELGRALADLDRLMVTGAAAAPGTAPFLQDRLAILPFENESVEVDAPAYARLKVYESLKGWGYNVLPMDEVDAKLRDIGITEGGQLRMTLEGTLAKALGAERLLFATIEELRVVNVGVYSRRQVKLAFRITDAGGRLLWENRAQTLEQDVAEPQKALKTFLVKVASTQLEKVMKVYLAEETDATILKAFETVPRYVPPKTPR